VVDNPKLGTPALGEFPLLPEWGQEADFVMTTFPSHERLSGDAATLPAVISALPNAEVFYFGGHGVSESENGGILLAPESGAGSAILDASRLEPAIKRCRLAILSACSTARGERAGAFNPDSLIQAFWRAGVPNVLATRWEVESRVTAELIPLLLRGLLFGESPAVALRTATRQIRQKPEFEHPATWAAFHFFGVS
jgi:CHAT domain-containing protein